MGCWLARQYRCTVILFTFSPPLKLCAACFIRLGSIFLAKVFKIWFDLYKNFCRLTSNRLGMFCASTWFIVYRNTILQMRSICTPNIFKRSLSLSIRFSYTLNKNFRNFLYLSTLHKAKLCAVKCYTIQCTQHHNSRAWFTIYQHRRLCSTWNVQNDRTVK